jgi:hypothetical protein
MATEKKRKSRNNRDVANSYSITDPQSAQTFCDEALSATKDEKSVTMFNGSGFVSPQILDNHSIDNLVRMASSIINSLSNRIGDNNESDAAKNSLDILSKYASGAATIQQNARNERILRQAEEIRKAQATV